MVYLERVDNDLESLANSGEAWKGRKMPGEMKYFRNSFLQFTMLS